jgi:hypothetical protein
LYHWKSIGKVFENIEMQERILNKIEFSGNVSIFQKYDLFLAYYMNA